MTESHTTAATAPAVEAAALVAAKQPLYASAEAQATASFAATKLSLRQKLAVACRALARGGHNAGMGLASQVSALDAEQRFRTQTYGQALEEATAANQVLVDFDLRTVDGTAMVNPANRFHIWIYRRRADVGAIVHTHPLHTSALAMLGVPLHIAHMDTASLFGRVAHLPEWLGVPFGDEEGRLISEALGDAKAILLAHHGLITVGKNIEEACTLAMVFEHAARLQLLALASALPLKHLSRELGDDARRFADQPLYALAHFEYYARAVIAATPQALL